jgi:hypothetical protein
MEDEEEDERHRIFPMTEKYLEYKMEYAWINSFFRSIYGKVSR